MCIGVTKAMLNGLSLPLAAAPPHVEKLSIVGDVIETRRVRLEATYVHADESLTTVRWFGAKEAKLPNTEAEEAEMGWTALSEESTEKVRPFKRL